MTKENVFLRYPIEHAGWYPAQIMDMYPDGRAWRIVAEPYRRENPQEHYAAVYGWIDIPYGTELEPTSSFLKVFSNTSTVNEVIGRKVMVNIAFNYSERNGRFYPNIVGYRVLETDANDDMDAEVH